ncbi:pentatricopeptide repeat-containing protein At1g26900, mitochondrial-like [Pistacia vera]|uniref:pentatricopeptide repeat-containing protein At1g26900, mitochondrial-like n=1 Tax=Pistacia vera TaxID=55513 RepID=UPI001263B762|nr:pentatricopeptide repeat-containing protein At1g26900, mitochondrial-like [Pistacia vera]
MNLANASLRLSKSLRIWPKNLDLDSENLISLLKSAQQITEISQIHGYMLKTGLDRNPFTLSKLLASSVQNIEYAASIFKHIQNPNLFMFNTMLRGYSSSDDPKQAFTVFNNLRAQSLVLDQFSYIATLKACARELAIMIGLMIHGLVLKSGYMLFINVKNTLLHFYCVSGKIGDAHKLLDEFPKKNDLVTWNTLMGGYFNVSQPTAVVDLFRQICRRELRVSSSTMLNILCAVGDLGYLCGGESLHALCIKFSFNLDLNVVTALIDFYAKLGDIDSGRRIFDEVREKDVILWNCMIDKYAKVGLLEGSIALLRLMKLAQVKANSSSLVGLLSACAVSGSLSLGQCIYEYVEEEVLVLDVNLGTALIDMYAKCGVLDKAINIFRSMKNKDVKCWTTMIFGYGVHGQARDAVNLFYKMADEGFRPNNVTFLAVLSSCSHGGLVIEGMNCFEKMVVEYGIAPKIEHYGCLVDLLGRAGLLEEAYNLIKSLPIKVDATAWRALLSACRVYGNVKLGECVLLEINDEHPTNSILVSSTYAIAGMLPDQTMILEKKEEWTNKQVGGIMSIRNKGAKMMKEAGCSTIEMER